MEHYLSSVHGELITGISLHEILANIYFSIIGVGPAVNINYIRQSREHLEVALNATYVKLVAVSF